MPRLSILSGNAIYGAAFTALLMAVSTGCGAAAPASLSSGTPNTAVNTSKTTGTPSSAASAGEAAKTPHGAAAKGPAPANSPFEFVTPRRPRQQANRTSRHPIKPTPIRLADLPVASILAPLPQASATRANFAKSPEATDLRIKITDRPAHSNIMQVAVSVENSTFSLVKIDTNEGWSSAENTHALGAGLHCGPRTNTILPARWEAFTVTAGGAEYSVSDGYFDQESCKAATFRSVKVKPAPLFEHGLIYAFRACRATCSEGEELIVIFPAANITATAIGGDAETKVGTFSRVSLPIHRGGGGSLMAKIDFPSLRQFAIAIKKTGAEEANHPGEPPNPKELQEVFMGIEIVQSIQDPEPIAIGYFELTFVGRGSPAPRAQGVSVTDIFGI